MSSLSTSGISFSGLASGLDTDGIINQLLQIEKQPIARLQQQQAKIQAQKAAYGQFKSQLQSLNSALSGLSFPGAFTAVSTTNSDDTVASLTANTGAPEGIHTVVAYRLASAQKLASAAQTSATDDLNLAGAFTVNSKSITVEATDSLNEIAVKINAADAGVSASVVNGGTGKAYLTIASKTTGTDNAIEFTETGVGSGNYRTGSILNKLGLVSSTKAPITGGFATKDFTNAGDSFETAMATANGVYELTLNGQPIEIDSTDTMTSIVNQLDALTGIKAQLVPTSGGKQRLEISTEDGSELSIADPDGFMSASGSLQSVTELTAAQDADYSVDGIRFTSDSNTLTDVIQGTTLTLNSAALDGSKTTNVAITKDIDGEVAKIKAVSDAYNKIKDYIKVNSAFDKDSFASGILFGDSVSQQIEGTLSSLFFNTAANVTGDYTNLTQIGFSYDAEGKLTLDEAKLKTALETNGEDVADLLRPIGKVTGADLTYVSVGSSTKASPSSGYVIHVTQPATVSTVAPAVTQTDPNRGGELLTFAGGAFGANGYQISLQAGSTMQDLADKINSDSTLKDLVTAEISGGKLKISSLRYGAASAFTVTSNYAGASDTSGIGTDATVVTGLDLAGTINGEEATGSGQFLLGKTGNTNTAGLQIQYTGTATGDVGTIVVSKGVGGTISDAISGFLESQYGLLTTSDKALDDKSTGLDASIKQIQDRAAARETELRTRFAAMEQALQASQQQLAQLQQMTAGLSR